MRPRIKVTAAAVTVAVTLLAGSAAYATTTSPTAPPDGRPCRGHPDDRWPAATQGEPAGFEAGDAAGVYVWQDASGWHVRVTHKTDARRTFSGQVGTRGVLLDVRGVQTERDDVVRVSRDHHVVTFRFANYGHVDGLDFTTRCAPALAFGFRSDGRVVLPSRIAIGADAHHPAGDPFVIGRDR